MELSELRLLYCVMVDYYGMNFRSKSRKRPVADGKSMFAYIARKRGAMLMDVAQYMGWRDHSTAIFAVRKMEDLMSIYPVFKKQYNDIVDEYEFRQAVGLFAEC